MVFMCFFFLFSWQTQMYRVICVFEIMEIFEVLVYIVWKELLRFYLLKKSLDLGQKNVFYFFYEFVFKS